MPRVVGTDPGTSSLDLLLLVDGAVVDQARLVPQSSSSILLDQLRRWEPLDLIAGPSGYGLPLRTASELTEADLELMSFVRPDERGLGLGLLGFRSWVRALADSALPVVFLPGGIHLPTIPLHRKVNAVDQGTADKVAVVALALQCDAEASGRTPSECSFALVEVGSAFSAILVVQAGQIVAASAGTNGPIGVRCSGAWDGELAYFLSPLSKNDLFRGGLDDLGALGPEAFFESLTRHLAGLHALVSFDRLYLSGASATRPDLAPRLKSVLERFGAVTPLPCLPGAWVKHSAQGSALLADGLADGRHVDLVESLAIRAASGTIWEHQRIRRDFANPFQRPEHRE